MTAGITSRMVCILHIEFCTSRHPKSAISRVASAGATGRLSFLFNAKTDGGRELWRQRHRRFHDVAGIRALGCDAPSTRLAAGGSCPNPLGMADDDIDDFRIRIGRARSRGARGNRLSQPFMKQVEAAVRERIPKPSSAPMSGAWRRCAGPAMWNASTRSTGASPRTSPSGAWPTTSTGAATASGSAPFRPSTSNGKSSKEERIARKTGDDVFLPREFSRLGGEDQVLRALRGFVRDGRLVRLGYGVYARAIMSRLTGEPLLYARNDLSGAVRQALDKLGVKWEPTESERAYNEGRSTQIPLDPVLRVKGRFSRRLREKDFAVLVREIMLADADTYGDRFPAYRDNPVAETLRAVDGIAAGPDFDRGYARFRRDMGMARRRISRSPL